MKISLYRWAEMLLSTAPEKSRMAEEKTAAAFRFFMRGNLNCLLENLSQVLGGNSWDRRIKEIAEINFYNFADNLTGFLMNTNKVPELFIDAEGEGLDAVRRLLERGESVAALSGHIGNWELLGKFGTVLGHPTRAVAAKHFLRGDTEYFIAKRAQNGVESIFPEKVLYFLKNNPSPGILAVLADRSSFGKPVRTTMFDKDVFLSGTTFKLALRFFDWAVFPFALKGENGKYIVYVHGPFNTKELNECSDAERELLNIYARIYEYYVRKYPEQWYFYRRFFA